MAKIEFSAHWDGKSLNIVNEQRVLDQLYDWQPQYLDGTIEPEFAWKTRPQLGYLWGEIAPKAMMGYLSRGVRVRDKEMAVALLMLEEEVDFTDKVCDEFTGQMLGRIPKRISAASRRELNEFMEAAIMFIESELGVEVETPEDYKARMKW